MKGMGDRSRDITEKNTGTKKCIVRSKRAACLREFVLHELHEDHDPHGEPHDAVEDGDDVPLEALRERGFASIVVGHFGDEEIAVTNDMVIFMCGKEGRGSTLDEVAEQRSLDGTWRWDVGENKRRMCGGRASVCCA